MLKPRPRKRIHGWIRQQRIILAIHKFIYYKLNESIYEDLQFDYLEKRLEVVEKRYPNVALAVDKDGILSPNAYVGALDRPYIRYRAEQILEDWIKRGRPRIESVPNMTSYMEDSRLLSDGLHSIVQFPI